MGEKITFPSDGDTCAGYLSDGSGPGVVVISERNALWPHVVDVTDRFGDAGFTALAPVVSADPARDLSAAVDLLAERTSNPRVGVVGYRDGGGLALILAAQRPDAVKAVAPYYGVIPESGAEPDWSKIDAKIVGEYAELDDECSPERAAELQATLRGLGKDATLNVHIGARDGFFNDSRHDAYSAEAALEAWERTLTLFRDELANRD